MPQVKALRTFSGRLGLIKTGDIFHCDDGYASALHRNGLIAFVKDGEPGPEKNRNIPQAPGRAGKEQSGGPGNPPASPPLTPADGLTLTSSSLQADLASRKKMPIVSPPGARKGVPTPRGKGKTKTASTPPAA